MDLLRRKVSHSRINSLLLNVASLIQFVTGISLSSMDQLENDQFRSPIIRIADYHLRQKYEVVFVGRKHSVSGRCEIGLKRLAFSIATPSNR